MVIVTGVVAGGIIGATVVAGAGVAGGPVVVVGVGGASLVDRACWKAAKVAASTTPVGSTPSAIWNSFSAAVSSSVHTPSIGPARSRSA